MTSESGVTPKELDERIQKNIIMLDGRCQILQFKYGNYKVWYDGLNIMIIVISTFLSISEALRYQLESVTNKNILFLFDFLPLCMSSFITCTVAIIKLQKYQENMEFMLITKEKVILTISRLREIQELIWSKSEKFNDIKNSYIQEVYPLFNSCNVDIERNIKYSEITEFNLESKDKFQFFKKLMCCDVCQVSKKSLNNV